MKTVSLIISSLLVLFTLNVTAQHHADPHHPQRGPREKMNPEQMIKKMVAQMKLELKLNEKQEKQVEGLFTAIFKKRGEIWKKYQGQRDSIMIYNKKLEKDQNTALEVILTEEQYKTYQANQEKKKKEWEKRRKEWEQRRKEAGNTRDPQESPRNEDTPCCYSNNE